MAVEIVLYRWAGRWGPFRIRVPCGECALSRDIIRDALEHELSDINAKLIARDWLSHWWQALLHGGWHAPIVLVDGRIISQGSALNRGVLCQKVIEANARKSPLNGNVLFGKSGCPHCQRAKAYLEQAGIAFDYRDVVKNPVFLYDMLARVKPLVGAAMPISVPQIWIDGCYIGSADALAETLAMPVQAVQERAASSLSPAG